MKIIGRSTITHKPNYIHLAHAVATYRIPNAFIFGPGLILFLTGCVLALRVKRQPGGHGIKIVFNRWNPQKLKYGQICLVAGLVLLFLGYRLGETRYSRPHSVSNIRVLDCRQLILGHLSVHGTFPEKLVVIPDSNDWQVIPMNPKDAWRNQLHLVKDINDGQFSYFVVSSGEDGIFDTKDDIISEQIIAPITEDNSLTEVSI